MRQVAKISCERKFIKKRVVNVYSRRRQFKKTSTTRTGARFATVCYIGWYVTSKPIETLALAKLTTFWSYFCFSINWKSNGCYFSSESAGSVESSSSDSIISRARSARSAGTRTQTLSLPPVKKSPSVTSGKFI